MKPEIVPIKEIIAIRKKHARWLRREAAKLPDGDATKGLLLSSAEVHERAVLELAEEAERERNANASRATAAKNQDAAR